jgi:hypothetical protein
MQIEEQKQSWANKTLTYMQTLQVGLAIIFILGGAVLHVTNTMAKFEGELNNVKASQSRLEQQQIRDNQSSEQKLDRIISQLHQIEIQLSNKENRK